MKLISIQYLRAIAALMVFIFHCDNRILGIFGGDKFAHYLNFGQYGVDIFFVLSGFIMAYIYKDNLGSIKDFALKRFFRIYPVYIVALLISSFVILIGFDYRNKSFSDLDIAGSLFLINPLHNNSLILAVAWTLSYEIWFYFIFGLSMFLFGKRFYSGIMIFALCTYFFKYDFFLTYRNYEFCAGVFIALLFGNQISTLDKKIKKIPFLLLLGNASYSIYLLHIPLLEFFGKIIGKFGAHNFLINFFWATILISIVIYLCILNYLFVEKRILKICYEIRGIRIRDFFRKKVKVIIP